ncbi:MAG: hypothetical protein PHV02_14290 [Rhodocyclaceae bacterium]|nr:hypothetical protein [Rhodocyclaceae bacterium]
MNTAIKRTRSRYFPNEMRGEDFMAADGLKATMVRQQGYSQMKVGVDFAGSAWVKKILSANASRYSVPLCEPC